MHESAHLDHSVIVIGLAFALMGATAAQGLQLPQVSKPPAGEWEERRGEPSGIAETWMTSPEQAPRQAQNAEAIGIALDQSAPYFRYQQTFGVFGEPYISTTTHLNLPYGLDTDGSNIWIVEYLGGRALKYSSDGSALAVIGRAGGGVHPDVASAWPHDVAVDGGGHVWIAVASRVLKFDATGNYVGQLGSDHGSGNDRFWIPNSVAFDSQGNIYVSDGSDIIVEAVGNHRIQVLDSSGNYKATLGTTGTPGTGDYQLHAPAHIVIDDDVLYVADRGNHRVQIYDIQFSPSYTLTYVATIGQTGVRGSDNHHFNAPRGVAVDANYIYVADTGNDRVQVFRKADRTYYATIGGPGQEDDRFDDPADVAVDASGYLYVADLWNTRVQQFRHDGETTWVYRYTYGTTGVPYITDDFHYYGPRGVAVGADGSIHITENAGRRLVKLASDGTPQWSTLIGTATRPVWPQDLTVGRDGLIYVGTDWEHHIRIYNPNGALYSSFGEFGDGNYQFWSPNVAAFGPNGDIYVVDSGNHRVQVYGPDWSYKATIGITRERGSDNAHFSGPGDAAVSSDGAVYVADRGNERVQRCILSGAGYTCETFAGVTGECGGDSAHLCGIGGIAVDGSDRVYVVDAGNNRVQVFDSNGAYLTTIRGRPGTRDLGHGIAVGADGAVYVTDGRNHCIHKFVPGVRAPGWKQVNISGFGNAQNGGISSLEVFNGQLYAGTANWAQGTQVWRMVDESTWAPASELGFANAHTSTNPAIIIDMIVFDGKLYASTGWDGGGVGRMWRSSDGTTWEQVVSNGFGDADNLAIAAFGIFSNTLYISTHNTNDGLEIWRSTTGNSGDWTPVVTDGNGDKDAYIATGLTEFNGYLYAAIENETDGAEIWRTSDGVTWTRVITGGLGNVNNTQTGAFAILDNYLYVGTKNDTTGSEIHRSADGTTWTAVVREGFGDSNNVKVELLYTFGGALYAGVANNVTGFEVWRSTDGTSWSQVNPDGFEDSSTTSTLWSSGTTVFSNRLYIGTFNWATGGEIWKETVTADFTTNFAAGSTANVGTTVTFTNLSAGRIVTTTWDFGDGFTLTVRSASSVLDTDMTIAAAVGGVAARAPLLSSADTVTHTYLVPGTYTVTLTVDDGVETDVRIWPACIRIARRTFLPLAMRHYNPLIAIYDDFNNAGFNGFYNPLKWRLMGDTQHFGARQQAGTLIITNTTGTPAGTGLDLPLTMPPERQLRQVQRFQARLKLGSGTAGTGANIQIMSDDLDGRVWWTQCSLNAYDGSRPSFGCNVTRCTGGQGSPCNQEYGVVWPSSLAFETWYTARIEIDPNTAQVCFYLNNNRLGCHVPNDANALKTATNLSPRVGSRNGRAGATGVRYFDDVYITPVGP